MAKRETPIAVRFPEEITRAVIKKRAKKVKAGSPNAYIVGLVKTDLKLK